MAVDLTDLIDPVKRETNPPGTNLFPNATDDDWLGQLQDSFWEARLFGLLAGYTEANGLVRPTSVTGTDLPRQEQQLIVLFAGIRAVRMALINTSTSFRAVAGPVEFETTNSATLLNSILAGLQDKINLIFIQLAQIGRIKDAYFDAAVARDGSLGVGDTFWWGSDNRARGSWSGTW